MSAYIVERQHIAYLVEALLSRTCGGTHYEAVYTHGPKRRSVRRYADPEGRDFTASHLGQILWGENAKSVAWRYGEEPEPVAYGEHEHGGWSHLDPVQIIKACHCYEYQACEHDGWKDSEARTVVEAIRERAVFALPGYDSAAWGAPAPSGARPIERLID